MNNAKGYQVNPEQLKLARLSQAELVNIYKDIFTSEGGKLILEDLRMRCYSYMPTYLNADGNTVSEIDFKVNEGKRSVILTIETMINAQNKEIETNEQAN